MITPLAPDAKKHKGKPYLMVWFVCCNVYQRVMRRPEVKHYEARCPRCLRAMRIAVDPKAGVGNRTFMVG